MAFRSTLTYLQVGVQDMTLDFIHSVCSIGDSTQMEPLKYHFILSERSCDREISSELRQGEEALQFHKEGWSSIRRRREPAE